MTSKLQLKIISSESLEAMREKILAMPTHANFSGMTYNGAYNLKHKTGASIEYHVHSDGDVQSIIYKGTNTDYINGCMNPNARIIFFSIVYTALGSN